MVENFKGLLEKTLECGLYLGLKSGTYDLVVSHLQYKYDIMIFGETTIKNIWNIKANMRSFKLAFSLRFNLG